MAAITISSYPTKVRCGQVITLIGTNFEDNTGTDPITSITVDLSTPVNVIGWRVISSTQLEILLPTVPNGTTDGITVTNGTGSTTTTALGDITFYLHSRSGFIPLPASSTGTFTTEKLQGKTGFIPLPASSSGIFTTEKLFGKTGFIPLPASSSGIFTTEKLFGKTGFIPLPASSSGIFTTASEEEAFLGALTFILNEDCTQVTITDSTDYTENGETRSNFNLSVVLTNYFTGEVITLTADSTDDTEVVEWVGTLVKDGIYEARLYHNSTTLRNVSFLLVNCAGNNCVMNATQKWKDNQYCDNCDHAQDLIEVKALNNILIAKFKQKQFEKAKKLIDEFQTLCTKC